MNRRVLRVAGQVIGGVLVIGCLVALSLCVWCVFDVWSFVRNAQLVDATVVGFSRPVTEDGIGRAPILRISLPSEQAEREEVVRLSGLYDVEAEAVGRQVPVLYNPEHAVRFAMESPWNWIGCYVYGSGALALLLASCVVFALARRRKALCPANACVVVMALCCGPLVGSAVLGAEVVAAPRAADLAPPVLVMAGGKPIDVDGYAAPFVGDFDGDGKNDLLVGQYVYGKLRIYRNVGTNAEPKFDGFEWFTVGGLPACVPAGCYVGFTPHLVDFDGDGRTDILTGSFPGVHFLFRRNSDGTFAQAEVLRDKHGEIQFGYPERHRYNSTVFVHDWDQDGKPDLLLGRHILSLVPNEGGRRQPVFGDAVPLEISGVRIPQGIVGPCVADWDGDGRDDLIIGRGGDIVWYRNVGEKGRPVLSAPQILVPDNHGSGFGEEPVGNGPRRFQAVCVADFNGDGRLDLLVGDTYTVANELPEPTPAQRAKDEETAKAKNQLWSEWGRLTADRPQGEAVQEHGAEWKKALRMLQELAAGDPDGTQSSGNLRSKRHGRVWLYARTAGSGRVP